MVQARAQVLIGSFLLAASIISTLRKTFGSTNGPFFFDRPIGFVSSFYRTKLLSRAPSPTHYSGILIWPYRRERRRRISAEFDGLRRLRVPPPLALLPVGLTGCRPPLVRPSPPPCGWSIGFIAVPRTKGRQPFQRLRPAL